MAFPLGYCDHILLCVDEITTPHWKKIPLVIIVFFAYLPFT